MNSQEEWRYGLAPPIPKHGTRWKLSVSVKNQPLHPREKKSLITIE
jgi:hypothetical protein